MVIPDTISYLNGFNRTQQLPSMMLFACVCEVGVKRARGDEANPVTSLSYPKDMDKVTVK